MPKSDAPRPRTGSYSAPALEKGFNVLEILADTPSGLTVSEIAARLGLSLSEIFRVVMVMEQRGWLRKGAGDKYRVTPKVLELAFRATGGEELTVIAAPILRDLCVRIEQSCHLVVRNGERGLVMFRAENPGPTGLAVRLGADIALDTTCSGHVLLAFAGDTDSLPELAGEFAKIRTRGFAQMKSTRTLGVTDISCPVFGLGGKIVAAVTVPFVRLIDGSQDVGLDQACAELLKAAQSISAEMTGGAD
ncbi:MAG: IclR family transcriptional regulator [Asticcacaulis sp.]|uniref:IclR family transcriptional regulator n=1 Tax=Asticcacaulis sp. TaxID=1872648 RepID=UPI0039E4A0B9